MKTVLHKANTRGHADHGWLKSNHSFSFAGYYDPSRMNFGVLRVLNDDKVSGGKGFGTHPHENMEIVSIPLKGDLEHKDSMGNQAIIREGDIQAMSAGTGVRHSEYNKNSESHVEFLQIWIIPNERNVEPRYDQITLGDEKNELKQILSPSADDDGIWIHQDAWFHMGAFTDEAKLSYDIKKAGNGVYAFLLEGKAEIAGQALDRRDGLGIWDTDELDIRVQAGTKLLLMDVPMHLN